MAYIRQIMVSNEKISKSFENWYGSLLISTIQHTQSPDKWDAGEGMDVVDTQGDFISETVNHTENLFIYLP